MADPRVESPETVASATRQDVEGLLHRLLHTGSLQGFPKRPEHRDILLAVAAMTLIRRRPYAEPEVNEILLEWLASVRGAIDHVTLRRRMVDCGFLRRTRDGSRYFLDYGRVAGILGNPRARSRCGCDSRRHPARAGSAQARLYQRQSRLDSDHGRTEGSRHPWHFGLCVARRPHSRGDSVCWTRSLIGPDRFARRFCNKRPGDRDLSIRRDVDFSPRLQASVSRGRNRFGQPAMLTLNALKNPGDGSAAQPPFRCRKG